jgi:predicted TIM-barrel fold metal-dependent hydrolase
VLADAEQTQIALCHCGSPWDQSERGIASWRAGLQQLAQLPNVACKISGLGMFDHHWTEDSIRPLVESCIEIFGVERCMFGSNFPVDSLHADYTRIWRAFESIASQLSENHRQKLFVGNAAEFYRINVAS